MLRSTNALKSLKVLIYIITLCVGPIRSEPMNPACHLQIIKVVEEYEYIQEGDIMIGGVMTVDLSMRNFTLPWEKSTFLPKLLCIDSLSRKNMESYCGNLQRHGSLLLQSFGSFGLISYGATDPLLSDRSTFPYFFRTVQSIQSEFNVLGKLLRHFAWTWVGVITSDDISGEEEHKLLAKYLSSAGICIEFTLRLPKETSIIHEFRKIISSSSTNIIIICGTVRISLFSYLLQLSKYYNETTFIITSNWAANDMIAGFSPEIFNCSLFLKVHLKSKHGEIFSFDENGEFTSRYQIYSHFCTLDDWFKNILGEFSPWAPPVQQLSITSMAIPWKTTDNKVRFSLTFYSIYSVSCTQCPDMEWPNEMKDICIQREKVFLSYSNDDISIFFSAICILFFLITQMILQIFIIYRDTPIVRANNRSLSFLLLVSIKLSFLSVFLFLGRPVDITCMLRIITFGITFSIAVSSLLAKTIMVCVAFKATKPGSSWRKWVGVKLSNSVVLFCSSIQIIICMTWLAISPPFQELDLHTYPGTIIIQCNEGSAIGFYSVIGYMGLLAAVSFVLAFLARTLPDSFNEAKYITFSMLLFCSVWITMIPAYLSTKGKNTVCVEIFAILTSSAGLLACIFLPKCYTILLRPAINMKNNILGNKYT
ncbi:hypothetical protein XELAEV_18004320mg [Xenopus laevis]|uniref:G-protein coupled receptors family 3 profile domain-containing protein n=1 Tax=Xenopus laevis TaxID=8355 RepID=A0A974BRD3_XENLA|nr:hypothetical protein XELAEV_18004320mg [Xenopus laevis]